MKMSAMFFIRTQCRF